MSHFPVLVVTDDDAEATLAATLQPFHEFECTGIDDEYVKDVDETDEARKEYEEQCDSYPSFTEFLQEWYGRETVPHGEQPDLSGAHKYGYALLDERGEVVKVIDRTNPNKTWDWWVVGGRWPQRLCHRAGYWCDHLQRAHLDTEAMRARNIKSRREAVAEVYGQIMSQHGLGHDEITAKWVRFCRLFRELDAAWVDSGRPGRFWDWAPAQSQEFAALRGQGIVNIGRWSYVDGANVPESETDPFAWAEKAPALSFFAFLSADKQWFEKGRMGWFACVHNEKDSQDWESELARLLADVRDDQYLTVVDCHI